MKKQQDTVSLPVKARVEVVRLENGVWLIGGECVTADDDADLIGTAVIAATKTTGKERE